MAASYYIATRQNSTPFWAYIIKNDYFITPWTQIVVASIVYKIVNLVRYTYDKAADHVYLLLLKKDCYPRFIRSDHYKNLLAYAINPGSSRKR